MSLTSKERRTVRIEQDGRVLAALMGENLECKAMAERVVVLRAKRNHNHRTQAQRRRARLGEGIR